MRKEDLARLLAQDKLEQAPLDAMNEREFELFSALAQGYSRGQIEMELGMSGPETVSVKRSIMEKLKLKSELALLQFAVKNYRTS